MKQDSLKCVAEKFIIIVMFMDCMKCCSLNDKPKDIENLPFNAAKAKYFNSKLRISNSAIKGELKELFVRDGIQTSAEFGTTILEINHLDMESIADDLFRFTCTANDGTTDSLIIATHSQTP